MYGIFAYICLISHGKCGEKTVPWTLILWDQQIEQWQNIENANTRTQIRKPFLLEGWASPKPPSLVAKVPRKKGSHWHDAYPYRVYSASASIATSLFNEFWHFSLGVSGCNRDLLPVETCYFGCWLGDKLQFDFPSQKPRKAKAKAKANPKAKAKAEAKTPNAKAAKVKAEESEEKNEKKAKAKAAKAAKVKAEESEDKKTKTKAPRWVDKMLTIFQCP